CDVALAQDLGRAALLDVGAVRGVRILADAGARAAAGRIRGDTQSAPVTAQAVGTGTVARPVAGRARRDEAGPGIDRRVAGRVAKVEAGRGIDQLVALEVAEPARLR